MSNNKVVKATVNLMTEQAEVEYIQTQLDDNNIKEAIEELGFEASIIEKYHLAMQTISSPQRIDSNNLNNRNVEGKVTLIVDGMSCAACVSSIENTLRKSTGIHKASVNLITKKAQVLTSRSYWQWTAPLIYFSVIDDMKD